MARPGSQQYCLRWNNYLNNLTNVFDQLLQSEAFVDVTLACDGNSLKAHKMILSACSPYFQTLFSENPCQHPIVILKDVRWTELKAIVEFVYRGEINVSQEQLAPLLKVAEALRIRGLADVNRTTSSGERSRSDPTSPIKNGHRPPPPPSSAFSSRPASTHFQTSSESEPNTSGRELSPPSRILSTSPHLYTNAPTSLLRQSYHHHRLSPNHHLCLGVHGHTHVLPMSSSQAESNRKRRKLSTDEHHRRSRSPSPSELLDESGSVQLEIDSNHEDYEAPGSPIGILETSVTPAPLSLSMGMVPHGPSSTASLNSIGSTSLLGPPPPSTSSLSNVNELDLKPGIVEMIREEERAKMLESSHSNWLSGSGNGNVPPGLSDSYQYQIQSLWQKCWNTNQQTSTGLQALRFRERGPLKSWRPETMAEAIFAVLREGLSLSQAARKFDIPYPTFVLYANRVHNMLGPSSDGSNGNDLLSDMRPKGRGRPQRILLGTWPEDHIRGVIRAVVFRDGGKEDLPYGPFGRDLSQNGLDMSLHQQLASMGHPFLTGLSHATSISCPSPTPRSSRRHESSSEGRGSHLDLRSSLVEPDNSSSESSTTLHLSEDGRTHRTFAQTFSLSQSQMSSPLLLSRDGPPLVIDLGKSKKPKDADEVFHPIKAEVEDEEEEDDEESAVISMVQIDPLLPTPILNQEGTSTTAGDDETEVDHPPSDPSPSSSPKSTTITNVSQ